jgi:sporulation inhibitor KapD
MYAVIFDLEATFTTRKGQIPEIVEIGAVKVNLSLPSAPIREVFHCYTLPEIRGTIGISTRKFIGLKEEDLEKMVPIKAGLKEFISWMGEEYYLCSWGNDDKRLLIEHCNRLLLSKRWIRNYNDIQYPISRILAGRNQIKLKDALTLSGIEQEGRLHSALTDAIHTAKLFIAYRDQIRLHKNTLE